MISMIGFHVNIGVTMYIGMFSWVMVAALLLLLSSSDLNVLKQTIREHRWKDENWKSPFN